MHLRLQVTGIYPPDAHGSLLRCQHVAGLLKPSLGGAVAAPARICLDGGVRGDAEHRPAAGAQPGQQQLGEGDRSHDIDLEAGTQVCDRVVRQGRQRAGTQRSGVVDQQAGAACRGGGRSQIGTMSRVCDAAWQRQHRVARQVVLGAQRSGSCLERRAVTSVDDELISGRGKGACQRAAEAAGGTGDDRYKGCLHGTDARQPRIGAHRPRAGPGLVPWSYDSRPIRGALRAGTVVTMGQAPRPVGGDSHSDAGQDEIFQRVSQVVLAVASQLSVRDVLQMIVRSARSLAGARYAALGVPGEAGSFAEFVVDGLTAREQAAIGPLPRQHGMLAVMLREGKPLRLDDIRTDPRFWGWPAAHPELTDVLGVPIKEGDQILGFIFAACKEEPGGFTDRDERLVSLFAAHAAIALTNARLYEHGRELSVLQERARLAQDLHDAVSQKLFSVRAKARAAAVLVGRDPARAIREIDSVAALAGEAHAELRAVIDGLAPPELAAGGLAGSVRGYSLLAGRTYGAEVIVRTGELPALDPVRATAVYRIAQEAITNALRHSGAGQILVSLTARKRSVSLQVSDSGAGFDAGAPRAGLGLASMRERAASAGGRLTITAAPGEGTTVRLTVPA